jgi:hypothetical protein
VGGHQDVGGTHGLLVLLVGGPHGGLLGRRGLALAHIVAPCLHRSVHGHSGGPDGFVGVGLECGAAAQPAGHGDGGE